MPRISLADYRSLAAFRYEIRKFLAFSEGAAREAGIEPQQHQMLLAVRGLPDGLRPTIGAIAERLSVQHHTAVALVDKLEARGFIRRQRSNTARREL
jgi:DNA-binding MarR family transcriptional regulator